MTQTPDGGVAPAYRRKGIGTVLLSPVESNGSSNGTDAERDE